MAPAPPRPRPRWPIGARCPDWRRRYPFTGPPSTGAEVGQVAREGPGWTSPPWTRSSARSPLEAPTRNLQESPGSTADAFSAVQTHFSLDGVPCAQRLLGPRARPACPVPGILRPLTGPSPPLRTPFWRPSRAQDPNPAWQPQFSASREGTRPYGATRVFSLQLYPSELSASKSPERRQEPPRS